MFSLNTIMEYHDHDIKYNNNVVVPTNSSNQEIYSI